MSQIAESADPSLQDYLTIALGEDLFGIKVALVHEVLDPPAMTRVPNAPAFAPGLVNVRGNVLPLIDLRNRFGMEPTEDTESTRLIVSEVASAGETFHVGIKTDAVFEVIHVRPGEVEAMPEYGTRWPSRYLDGVVRQDGRFVVLLDVEQLLEDA